MRLKKAMDEARTIDNETLIGEIRSLLSEGKRVKLRAKGSSMRPFIRGNEDILVLAPSDSVSKGDVVLASINGNRYVVHRVVGINGDRLILMGDGNLRATEECFRSDVFGTVESVIRAGRVHAIGSRHERISAKAWRFILPLRRLKVKLSNRLKRK